MRAIGIIPARYASTRLAEKMLIEINGQSIIERTYKQALKASKLSAVIAAVDDKRIFDKVKSFGGEVVMTSPECPSGTDRINEAAKNIDADIFVNIQGDEPLISPIDINNLVDSFSCNKVDISTLCHLINNKDADNSDIVKVVRDSNDFALFFSRSKIPFDRDNLGYNKYYKHIGIYAYKQNVLEEFCRLPQSELEKVEKLEQMRALENGYKIKVIETKNKTISIDTKKDLEELRKEKNA